MSCKSFLVNDFMTEEDIFNENYTLLSLFASLNSDLEVMQWCARRGLLKNECRCKCGELMILTKTKEAMCGYRWECNGRDEKHERCRKSRSVKSASIFDQAKKSMKTTILIMYLWAMGDSQVRFEYF